MTTTMSPPERVDTSRYLKYPQYGPKLPGRTFSLYPKEVDELLIDTFLLESSLGYGGAVTNAWVVVKPNEWTKPHYRQRLTPGKRLLYGFWHESLGAYKSLRIIPRSAASMQFRFIIQPGDPGHTEIEGFKILCDHRVGHVVPMTLLDRALALADRQVT